MVKLDEVDGVQKKVMASQLDQPTQNLMKLIFDNDMFKEAMQSFDIGKWTDVCVKVVQLKVVRSGGRLDVFYPCPQNTNMLELPYPSINKI